MNDNERLIKYWSYENILQQKKGYFNYVCRKMFDKILDNVKSKEILDVGCGLGMTMEYFIKQGARCTGIDITPQSVKELNSKGMRVVEGDARLLPFRDNSFDIVYSLGVIEHIKETQQALNEQVRVCRRGGIVIAVVPNLITPYSVAGILFQFVRGSSKYGLRTTYGKAFLPKKLKNMFIDAGCRNITIEAFYGSAFLRVIFNRLYANLVDAIERSIFSKYCGLVLWGMGYKK